MDISFSIGEVSEIYDVSIDTLRYYDKIGLLHPKINERNGYRIYQIEELRILEFILSARTLEFPIKQIKDAFELEDINLYQEMFVQQEDIVDKEIERLQNLKKYISANRKNSYDMLNFKNITDLSSLKIETSNLGVFKLNLESSNQRAYNKNLMKAFRNKVINKSYYNDYILKDGKIEKNHNVYIFEIDTNQELINYANSNEFLNFKRTELPSRYIHFKFAGSITEVFTYIEKVIKHFNIEEPLILIKRIAFVVKKTNLVFFTEIIISFK